MFKENSTIEDLFISNWFEKFLRKILQLQLVTFLLNIQNGIVYYICSMLFVQTIQNKLDKIMENVIEIDRDRIVADVR